jgi:hypothetical protein
VNASICSGLLIAAFGVPFLIALADAPEPLTSGSGPARAPVKAAEDGLALGSAAPLPALAKAAVAAPRKRSAAPKRRAPKRSLRQRSSSRRPRVLWAPAAVPRVVPTPPRLGAAPSPSPISTPAPAPVRTPAPVTRPRRTATPRPTPVGTFDDTGTPDSGGFDSDGEVP